MAKFSHAFDIAFEVTSETKDGSDVTLEMVTAALRRRISQLELSPSPNEWQDAIGAPCDTMPLPEDHTDGSLLFILTSAINSREQHFKNLNLYQELKKPAEWMLGKYWLINEDIYNEFLNLLPPRYTPSGFKISELLTDDIAATFFKIGDNYWCGFTNSSNLGASVLANHIRSLP